MKKKNFSLKLLSLLLAAMMVFSAAYVSPEFSSVVVAEAASSKTVKMSKVKVKVVSSVTYNGKAQKPKLKVTYGKKTLKQGRDFTVKYSSNKAIGTAKITLTGVKKKGYSGTKTVTFKILPAKVTSVAVSAATSNTVSLSWKAVKGAAGYVIYSYNSKTKKYKSVATVKSNKATVNKLAAGTAYSYAVKAYKKVGKTTYYSSAYSSRVNANTAPAKVASVSVAYPGGTTVKLSWKAVKGAAGYDVFLFDAATKKYTLVGTTKNASLTVSPTAFGEFSYVVRAYSLNGKKKAVAAYSPAAKASVSLGKVENLALTSPDATSVSLTWSKQANALGYEVYYCPAGASEEDFVLLTKTTATSFSVKNLDKGSYGFAVRAYTTLAKKTAFGEFSDVVTAEVATEGFKVQNISKIFSTGVYQMTFTTDDPELGTQDLTLAARNGDVAIKTSMDGFDMRIVYLKKEDKTYLIASYRKLTAVVDDFPKDQFDISKMSGLLDLAEIPTDKTVAGLANVDGKVCVVNEIIENGNGMRFYFNGNNLVRIDSVSAKSTNVMKIKNLKASVDSNLFLTSKLGWVKVSYKLLDSFFK